MAKRFSDTTIITKGWYRKLPVKMKAAWWHLVLACDHAGILEVDLDYMSFHIGEEITVKEINNYLGEQAEFFDGGSKIFLKEFITFQYGELKETNNVHKSVIGILKKRGLYKGLPSPLQGAIDKDKDKDKEKDKEKDLCKEIPFTRIIGHLNKRNRSKFKDNSTDTTKRIKARWKENFSEEDFKKVIDAKVVDSLDGGFEKKYLRPETLFGNKFEGYLQEYKQEHTERLDGIADGSYDGRRKAPEFSSEGQEVNHLFAGFPKSKLRH